MHITTIIGGYLWYVAAHSQQLHNKFGRVGYINLMDNQGLFNEHEGDDKEGLGCLKDGRRLFCSSSILLQ